MATPNPLGTVYTDSDWAECDKALRQCVDARTILQAAKECGRECSGLMRTVDETERQLMSIKQRFHPVYSRAAADV